MSSLILSVVIVNFLCSGQGFEPYVHDTRGDHGPYYYWKLRKAAEAKAKAAGLPEEARAAPAPKPTPAPVSAPAPVRQPAPAPAQSRFANFQALPATAPAAPAAPRQQQQRFRVRVAAPRQQQRQQQQQQRQQQQQPQVFSAPQPQQPDAAPVSADPHFAPPSGLRFQFQIQAPEFNYQNNFADNAYSFSSPFYSTNAQGGTYSYAAVY